MTRILSRLKRPLLLLGIVLSSGIAPSCGHRLAVASTQQVADAEGFVVEAMDGKSFCRQATHSEAQSMLDRGSDQGLHVISPPRASGVRQDGAMLNIVLRATQQLEGFPQAKAAFLTAAARWESLIQTPITVVVDVDFGPKHFGTLFDEGTIGVSIDTVIKNSYSRLLNALVASTTSDQKRGLYGALPEKKVRTTAGKTKLTGNRPTLLRGIGLLNAVADPDQDKANGLGDPPAIGFNSAIPFDFDPSDGIESDKFDFDAAATHEIGHVLGFASANGVTEDFPGSAPYFTVLDLFRFTPGTTVEMLATARRILTTGGDQVFFAGGPELPLSTGPTAKGGDGWTPGHWKAKLITGIYIGIMDPALLRGERRTITNNDLKAFDTLGYQMNAGLTP